jgi:protein-tyrosine phosphatase
MIDIHSHLLHGLDDGADSFETSVVMAHLARTTGTTDIVATPHLNISYRYDPELLEQRIRDLQCAVGTELRIHRGCDFHLSAQNIQMAVRDARRFSVNGLGYLLVEFPEVSALQSIEQIFETLREAGLTLVITHPERNPYLADDFGRLIRWVDNGIYLQVTAQSLVGDFFGAEKQSWCAKALKMGLVHFVASDAHDARVRPPRLDHAKAHLEQHYGEAYADLLLVTHPGALVEGRALVPGRVLPPQKRERKWFHFGRRSTGTRDT